MFDTNDGAVVEVQIDDEEMTGIETSVLGVLEDRKEQAITVEEMRKVLQGAFTRKQLYSALYRLELRNLTFRFLVDDKEYVALVAYRTTAYVITPFALSPKIELLYSGFGIKAPATLLRSPKFVVLADDEERAYSRYIEQAELADLR